MKMQMDRMRGLVVGLSGVSCGGKTTISKLLRANFPWCSVLHQDAYFLPNEAKYHVLIPQLNHFNWELKSALDLKRMERDLLERISEGSKQSADAEMERARFFPNDNFVNKHYPTDVTINYLRSRFSSIPLTIIEGHIIFNHEPFYNLCDLRYFFTLEEEECRKRRAVRVYDPPNPKGFFDLCVWPAYRERLKDVRKLPGIQYFDAKALPLIQIYRQIFTSLTSSMEAILDERKGKSAERGDQGLATPDSPPRMKKLEFPLT